MTGNDLFQRLFIFELANNHSGDVAHGIRTIQEILGAAKKFNFHFAFKFQYRNLETFIHPDYKNRMDLKYIKRFSETVLTEEDFLKMKKEVEAHGALTICTPFDEESVDRVVKHQYDILKIASCSFTDWPLLEKIVRTELPIIASTAGASLEEIDQVVAFFEHRNKQLCIMHCVGEYPIKRENLQLNQIVLLKKRYPGIPIGFSTHEEPDNTEAIKMAIAKGATVFERHVAVESSTYPVNAYSSTPLQITQWLRSAQEAYLMSGVEDERYAITEKEKNDLQGLKRGVFAKGILQKGDKITKDNVFYAIPCTEGQLVANDLSKYTEYTLERDLQLKEAVCFKDLKVRHLREQVLKIVKELKEMLLKAHVALPNKVDLELSHHYGIEKYEEWGAAILNCINREYCKKLIVLLPGQKHPVHHHLKKEETFYILYGSMEVLAGAEKKSLKAGDMLTLERGMNHDFSTAEGVIFEEVSTTHYENDSFYEDERIGRNQDRKTALTFRADWLYKSLK